jgi:CHAT domain-containing protein
VNRLLLTEVTALLVDERSSVGADAQRELLVGRSLGREAKSLLADVERYQRQQSSARLKAAQTELAGAMTRAPRRPDPSFSARVLHYAAGKQQVPVADPVLARHLALAATELSRREGLDLAGTLRSIRPDALPLREIVVARYASPPARLDAADLKSIAVEIEPRDRLLELAPLLVDPELDGEQLRRRRDELLAYWVAVHGLRRRSKPRLAPPKLSAPPVEAEEPPHIAIRPARPSGPPPPDGPPPPNERPRDALPDPEPDTGRSHETWPLLEAPDAVAPETVFTVTVGLSPSPVAGVGGTGPLTLPTGPFTLDLELVVDSDSFTIVDGSARRSLDVNDDDPYPTLTMQLSASADEALKPVRQLGCSFLVDGVLCGYATRLIEVVPKGAQPEGIEQPQGEAPPIDVLELDPETLPDLTIVIETGDDRAGTKLLWKLYSPCVAPPVDIEPRDIGESPQDFTTNIINTGDLATDDPLGLFDHLVGRGIELAAKMPREVQRVLTALPAAVTSGVPAVLIATADPYLPWEIAVLDKELQYTHPDQSPFLGARVAIGRWPLTSTRPAPKPPAAVVVRHRAVVSGSYMEVQGLEELEAAKAEGEDLLASWPGAHGVEPTYTRVRALLRGSPEVDVVHVALHGKFSDSVRNGLVLIATDKEGFRTPYYLQPSQVLGWRLERRPFVFLNACQVAAGTRVLGDHAGMASSLLAAGAASVVAPLWSIDDAVARSMATEFYKSALDAPAGEAVAVAELLRRDRAAFTSAAIESGEGAGASTHLAFQYFGHPRLELRKA